MSTFPLPLCRTVQKFGAAPITPSCAGFTNGQELVMTLVANGSHAASRAG